MEQSDLNKRLDVIIEKRKNCIQLTKEEETLANESLNKLLDAKKCVCKTMSNTTGEEIRKSAASPELKRAPSTDKATEGVPPKQRPKEGGYDSKADVAERTEVTPGSVQVAPVKADKNLTDKKEEKLPTEKTDGKPYGDKTKEEWADADNKKFKQENYQEDRLGRMTEHADYTDSIKIQSIVTKSLSNGTKMVGRVLKVYNTKSGQTGLMVKWADGRFEHVNQSNVELLKAIPATLSAMKPLAAAALGAGTIVAGNVASDVASHLTIGAIDSYKKKKAAKAKLPAAVKPERDQAAERAVIENATKAVGESDVEKNVAIEASKKMPGLMGIGLRVLGEGVKHKRAALAGAVGLAGAQAISDATRKVAELTAGDVVDVIEKMSEEEFDSLTKSMEPEALKELGTILEDMEKGWKGAGKGAKAGAKIGAVLGGLSGGAAGAIQGGMTHGVKGAVAGGVIGGAAGAATGAVSNVVPGAAVGHVIEQDENKAKAKKDVGESDVVKVEGSLAPNEEKKAAAPEAAPEAAPTAPAEAPAGEALPTEAPEEFIRGVMETLTELTDLSEEEILKIAHESWSEIIAEEGNASEGEEAPAKEEAPVEEAPAEEAKEEEKTMEAGDIKKEPKE